MSRREREARAAALGGGAPSALRELGPASAEKRLRPERGAESPRESERGWGPASAESGDAAMKLMTMAAACVCLGVLPAAAETRIRIMPPDGGVLAAGQRVDVRVEATSDGAEPPRGLTVLVNGKDVTASNVLASGPGGERGAGGTGTVGPLPPAHRAGVARAKHHELPDA